MLASHHGGSNFASHHGGTNFGDTGTGNPAISASNPAIDTSSQAIDTGSPAISADSQAIGTDDSGHMLSRMFMIAGPMTTTNSAGKMQNTIGMSIFTGAFCARS